MRVSIDLFWSVLYKINSFSTPEKETTYSVSNLLRALFNSYASWKSVLLTSSPESISLKSATLIILPIVWFNAVISYRLFYSFVSYNSNSMSSISSISYERRSSFSPRDSYIFSKSSRKSMARSELEVIQKSQLTFPLS